MADLRTEIKKPVVTLSKKQETEQLKKQVTDLKATGFKLIEMVSEESKNSAYCMKCKKIQPIKNSFVSQHKNCIRFLRGRCVTCGTECWKEVKKNEND